MAELLAAERVVLEERELPAVERVAELRVLVGERKQRPQLLRDGGAEGVQPRGLPGRRGRGDLQDGTDTVRTPVEPFEEHRPGSDRRGGREAKRGHSVRELAGRVGRLFGNGALELEHAQAVRLPPEGAR